MSKLIIIGTGPFAEIAKIYFEEYTNFIVEGFACHLEYKKSDEVFDCPLYDVNKLKYLFDPNEFHIFVAIGMREMNKVRQKIYEDLRKQKFQFATFIHPDVKIWKSNNIGQNVFIFEKNTIQPFVTISDNTILWSGNHIGHHSKIGSHCFLTSHVVVSGLCSVGDNVFIGVNAALHDNITVGNNCFIGPGSIVSRSTKDCEAYIHEPTRKIPGGIASLIGVLG